MLLGLSVALAGAVFVWLMARSYLRAKEMRSWPTTSCVILSSELEQRNHDESSPTEFRHNVVFGYEWNGQAMTSDHVSLRGSAWTSKPDVIEKRLKEFPEGSTQKCWVSPADPEFAILKPDSLAPGYSIWFPCLFVVGGLGITIRAGIKNKPKESNLA